MSAPDGFTREERGDTTLTRHVLGRVVVVSAIAVFVLLIVFVGPLIHQKGYPWDQASPTAAPVPTLPPGTAAAVATAMSGLAAQVTAGTYAPPVAPARDATKSESAAAETAWAMSSRPVRDRMKTASKGKAAATTRAASKVPSAPRQAR